MTQHIAGEAPEDVRTLEKVVRKATKGNNAPVRRATLTKGAAIILVAAGGTMDFGTVDEAVSSDYGQGQNIEFVTEDIELVTESDQVESQSSPFGVSFSQAFDLAIASSDISKRGDLEKALSVEAIEPYPEAVCEEGLTILDELPGFNSEGELVYNTFEV